MRKIYVLCITILLFSIGIFPSIDANVFNLDKTKNNDSNWLKYRCGYIRDEISDDERMQIKTTTDLPEKFDWRDYNDENWLTSVKNQGACGSCTAFAVASVIEAKINIQNNNPDIDRDLSEAHIFFCTGHECSSGSGFFTLTNFIKENGICDELSFPYGTAEVGNSLECDVSKEWRCNGISVRGCRSLDEDIETIKNALIQYGPLSASMDVYLNFESYIGGVYDSTIGDIIGYHAVCIVGYDDDNECWICKNSWGKLWGEKGFFRIKYGLCDIEYDVKVIKEVYELYPESPNIPDKPSGTLIVKPDYYGDYETKASDPNNKMIKYLWDWDGDYEVDYESSFLESGEKCKAVNKWANEGTYEVRVRVENSKGLLSDWSTSLKVNVGKSRDRDAFTFFERWDFPLLSRILNLK